MKSARVKAGKTVAQVMKEMGVSDAAVYMWETGKTKPRASLLPRLASFYGCTIDELLAADD
jgi:transcriptional regulator with XRE-family HTH domain